MLTPLGSHHLFNEFQNRRNDVSGILNGCDYSQWDPVNDPYIAKNYHHADTYRLDEKDFNDLLSFQRGKLANLENYWLLAQAGDETLDYRLAQERYKGCHQTIEQGGDHSFQNFENLIPQIINFFENKSVK